MSARCLPTKRRQECHALAAMLARHAPRGAVRVAEALASAAMNHRRRAERLWNGVFAGAPTRFDELYAGLPDQPVSARADAAWNAVCRRIAARAFAKSGPDPAAGGHCVLPIGASPPAHASLPTAQIGPYAFYREDA